jgi:hypothetical protein
MRASEFLPEHEIVWSRTGGPNANTGVSLKLKWRCTSGLKKGRLVPDVSVCGTPKDMDKANRMKRTRANTKIRQARRASKTKRVSPASKLLALLNKQTRISQKASTKKSKVKRKPNKPGKVKQIKSIKPRR